MCVCAYVSVHMPNSNSKSKPVEPVANSICIWALELRYIFYFSAEPECANVTFGFWVFGNVSDTLHMRAITNPLAIIYKIHYNVQTVYFYSQL